MNPAAGRAVGRERARQTGDDRPESDDSGSGTDGAGAFLRDPAGVSRRQTTDSRGHTTRLYGVL